VTGPGDRVIRRQEIPSPPARNLYELGRRLVLLTSEEVSRFTEPPPPALKEGDRLSMWVNRNGGNVQTDAVVARVSDNAYWLFDLRADVDDGALDRAIAEFESNIWPTVTGTFGPIWSPGIDSDPRIVILHSRLASGVGGYFSGADSYPRSIQPHSNEREIIYISTENSSVGDRTYLATLAHELQHAVHWAADPDEDTWLNEGLAELASNLAGYRPSSIASYLRSPATSLTEWAAEIGESSPNYGAAALFTEYLMDHYGGPEALRELVLEPEDGLSSVSAYLASAGYSERALDVFRDWLIANYLDDPSGRFSYPRRDLKTGVRLVTKFVLTPGVIEEALPPLAASYHIVSLGAGDVVVDFTGDPAAQIFPVAPASGESCWWSNAGDSIDTTLTRRLDLTRLAPGSAASFSFSIWHAIEEDWDYAYVEASADGGVTWRVLPAGGTTDSDPNGNAYGPGYTGDSGGWRRYSADLSAYSGREVLLRFEYITDDAVHGRGACLDDFEVRETGWSDSTETAGDWRPEGFALVNNFIPQDYLLMAVRQRPGEAAVVVNIPVGPDGAGRTVLEGVAADEQVVLIISPVIASVAGSASYRVAVNKAP
jgi:hypothetical protein